MCNFFCKGYIALPAAVPLLQLSGVHLHEPRAQSAHAAANFCRTQQSVCNAETRGRAGDLQIFSLTLSQLSYRGSWRISFAKVKRQDSIGTARIQGAALEVKPLHLFRAQGGHAETRDRTGDLQIFSLTLSQLSYRSS